MQNEATRKTSERATLHASNRKTPKGAAFVNFCRVASNMPASSVALEASSKIRLAEASERTDGEVQTGDREMKTSSTVADIFSMEIPRRPRSKRSTTVVKLMNFSFRDLPSLLDKKTMSRRQRVSSTQPQQKSEEKDEEKIPRKAPRKPKSDATPQRIVFEQNGTSRERRQRRRRPSCGLPPPETEFTDAMLEDDASRSRFEHKRARVNTIHTRGRAKIERERISKKTKQDESHKKRSLRSVIDRCQKEEKNRTPTTTTTATISIEKETPPPTPPSPTAATISETTSPPPTPPPPENDTVDPTPPDEMTTPEDDIHPDCCPTVADLLKKEQVRVGDYVSLSSANSDLIIEGWITCRGILCAHCATVHWCDAFGACADVKSNLENLRGKNGCAVSQLLQGDS